MHSEEKKRKTNMVMDKRQNRHDIQKLESMMLQYLYIYIYIEDKKSSNSWVTALGVARIQFILFFS